MTIIMAVATLRNFSPWDRAWQVYACASNSIICCRAIKPIVADYQKQESLQAQCLLFLLQSHLAALD